MVFAILFGDEVNRQFQELVREIFEPRQAGVLSLAVSRGETWTFEKYIDWVHCGCDLINEER